VQIYTKAATLGDPWDMGLLAMPYGARIPVPSGIGSAHAVLVGGRVTACGQPLEGLHPIDGEWESCPAAFQCGRCHRTLVAAG
jgi:hypothetical protein